MKIKYSLLGVGFLLAFQPSYAVMNLMCEDFNVNTIDNTENGQNKFAPYRSAEQFETNPHPYYSNNGLDISTTTDPQTRNGLYMGESRRKDSNDIVHYWCDRYFDCSTLNLKTETKRDMCPDGYSGSIFYERTYPGTGRLNKRLYQGNAEECIARLGYGQPTAWRKVSENCQRVDMTSGDTDVSNKVCNTVGVTTQYGTHIMVRRIYTEDAACPTGQKGTTFTSHYRQSALPTAQNDAACDASMGPKTFYGSFEDCVSIPALTNNTCDGWRTLNPNGSKSDTSANGKKYTFIPTDKITYNGQELTRICMLTDHIDSSRVNMDYSAVRGTLGGYLANSGNLSTDANDKAWIGENTYVSGGNISGRVFIIGESRITGSNIIANPNQSGEFANLIITGNNTIRNMGYLTASEIHGSNTITGRQTGVVNEISNAYISGTNTITNTDVDRALKADYSLDTSTFGILSRIEGNNNIFDNTEDDSENQDYLYVSFSNIIGKNTITQSRVHRANIGNDAEDSVTINASRVRNANVYDKAYVYNSVILKGTNVYDNASIKNVNYYVGGYRLNFIGGSEGATVNIRNNAVIDLDQCDTSKFTYNIETIDNRLRQAIIGNKNNGKFLVINRNAEVTGNGKAYCGFLEGNARIESGGVLNGQLRNSEVVNQPLNTRVNLKVYVSTSSDGSVTMSATSTETD